MAVKKQTTLFNTLPEGIEHYKQVLSPDEQIRFVELCRKIVAASPLITPTMFDGTPLRLKITSCGKTGWIADQNGYRYARNHPVTKKPWAKMPREFSGLARRIGDDVNWIFNPDTCLLNFYDEPTSRLRLHQDISETDLTQIIITLSLGDSCIFAVREEKNDETTGERRKITRVRLDSGDVIVMHRKGRLLYHGVEEVMPGTNDLLKRGGRISLTFRKAL